MNDSRNNVDFLTTQKEWGLEDLLSQVGSGIGISVMVVIEPRHSKTGLLEERGQWIQQCWRKVLARLPNIYGTRLLWSELLFIYPGNDIDYLERQFAEILAECRSEHLKNLCILSAVSGDAKEKLQAIERMENGFKAWNFGDIALYRHCLLDGQRFQK